VDTYLEVVCRHLRSERSYIVLDARKGYADTRGLESRFRDVVVLQEDAKMRRIAATGLK
jgi:hypothetical protein